MKNKFDDSIGFLLHDVARLMRWDFDRQAQDLGLTRAQWSVLAHLKRNDGVKQGVLAQLMDITPITLARHIDKLEQEGWVERHDDPEDRRAKRLFLSGKSDAQLKLLQQLGRKVRNRALSGISADAEAEFLKVLRQMRDNLSESRE